MPLHRDGPEHKCKRTAIDRGIAICHKEHGLQQGDNTKIFSVKRYAENQKEQKQGVGSQESIAVET